MLVEKFIKDYCNDIVCIIEVDIEYPPKLHDLYSDLPFLPERMKINKCNKLVCTIHDKKLCCPHKEPKASIKAWSTPTCIEQLNFIKKHGLKHKLI